MATKRTTKVTRRGLGKAEKASVRESEPPPSSISCPPPQPSKAPKRSSAPPGRRSRGPSTMRGHASSTDVVARVTTSTVPRLAPRRADLAKAPLAPREAFLFTRIDGALTVDELADLTGIPAREVVLILRKMLELGLVEL